MNNNIEESKLSYVKQCTDCLVVGSARKVGA